MGLFRAISDRLPREPLVTSGGEVVTSRKELHDSFSRQWLEFSDEQKRGLVSMAERDPAAAELLGIIRDRLGDQRFLDSLPH